MKKYILTLLVVVSSYVSQAALVSSVVNIPPGAMTNLFSGPANVSALVISATTATNVSATLFDTTTNSNVYVTPAYTNVTSYATNYVMGWTNYFGSVNTWTNVSLVDLSVLVPASTNLLAPKGSFSAVAGGTTTIGSIPGGIQFVNGLWVTNTGSGNLSFSVTFRQ